MSNIIVVGSISTDFIVGADKRPLVGETIEGKALQPILEEKELIRQSLVLA